MWPSLPKLYRTSKSHLSVSDIKPLKLTKNKATCEGISFCNLITTVSFLYKNVKAVSQYANFYLIYKVLSKTSHAPPPKIPHSYPQSYNSNQPFLMNSRRQLHLLTASVSPVVLVYCSQNIYKVCRKASTSRLAQPPYRPLYGFSVV